MFILYFVYSNEIPNIRLIRIHNDFNHNFFMRVWHLIYLMKVLGGFGLGAFQRRWRNIQKEMSDIF